MRQGIYSAPKYLNNHYNSYHHNYQHNYQHQPQSATPKKWPQDIECIIKSHHPQRGSLYLSNVQAAQNLSTVTRLKIGAILTCAKGYQLSHPKDIVPLYMYIPGQDKQTFDISIHFDQAVKFIENALEKTNIIVHCIAGVSRSVSMVIAYFIKNKNISYQQAYYQVKSKRKIINPNQGFVSHLKKYQKRIRNKNINQSQVQNKRNELQNEDIEAYRKTATATGTFYTPKKSIQYYRNLQSQKNLRNPQLPLQQSTLNIKPPSVYESNLYYQYSPSRRNNQYNRFNYQKSNTNPSVNPNLNANANANLNPNTKQNLNIQTNDNITSYERYSKSMSMIPNDYMNRPKSTKNIQKNNLYSSNLYSSNINVEEKKSPQKKMNNYMTENKSTTLNRNQLLYENNNKNSYELSYNYNKNNTQQKPVGYFDSMNTQLNQKIQAIRKKYQQQRLQMTKGYGSKQASSHTKKKQINISTNLNIANKYEQKSIYLNKQSTSPLSRTNTLRQSAILQRTQTNTYNNNNNTNNLRNNYLNNNNKSRQLNRNYETIGYQRYYNKYDKEYDNKYDKEYDNKYDKGYDNKYDNKYENRKIRMQDAFIPKYNHSYGSIYAGSAYQSRRYY